MRPVRIDSSRVHVIKEFIDRMGDSSKTFRYFDKRPVEVIKQHLVTMIGFDDGGFPVSYGHLDPAGGDVWLGVCVAEGFRGKGLGTEMIAALKQVARKMGIAVVKLAVDRVNTTAIRTYENMGFAKYSEDERLLYYSIDLLLGECEKC